MNTRRSSASICATSAIAMRRADGRWTSVCATPAPGSAPYANGRWAGNYFGTHAPALVWYSPDMYAWLKANRPGEGAHPPAQAPQIPDGAIIVKEMYRARRLPARASIRSICAPTTRAPPSWCATAAPRMTAGSGAGSDGTIGSRTGRSGRRATPIRSWGLASTARTAMPPRRSTPSRRSRTSRASRASPWFSSARISFSIRHGRACTTGSLSPRPRRSRGRRRALQSGFCQTFSWWGDRPDRDAIVKMPSVSYDNVWVKAPPPTAASQFVTSDQCLGCHSAGGTGLHTT